MENLGSSPLTVNDFDVWLPLPDRAVESMDFTGRWAKERQPQRREIQYGVWTREGREGRPGFDHSIVQLAMTKNASFQNGEVWSAGVEFSGNPRYGVERQPTGKKAMLAGMVLLPGEIIVQPGETHHSAPVIAGIQCRGPRWSHFWLPPVDQVTLPAPHRREAPPAHTECLGGGVLQPQP